MICKAEATCSNGHTLEFGHCGMEHTKFFFFKSICESTDHELISRDEIQCQKCGTIHLARVCPKCDETVPVAQFRQKGQKEEKK